MIAELSPSHFLELIGRSLRWELVRSRAESDRRVNELVRMVEKSQNLPSETRFPS
jgi:hypothetical protein